MVSKMTHCTDCGTKSSEGHQFCSGCGKEIKRGKAKREDVGVAKAIGGIIGIILIIGVVLAGIWGFNLLMDSSISIPIIKEPRFVVVSQSGNDGMDSLNYVNYVTCYVRNEGNGAGAGIVTAELFGGGGNKVLTKTVYLRPSEAQEVKFTFDTSLLGSLFGSSSKYRCSVRKT